MRMSKRRGRTALGAQPAVDANVLVLHHDPLGLRQLTGREKWLGEVLSGRGHKHTQFGLLCAGGDKKALHGTHVDARVALDAQMVGEVGLHVAVEAALQFAHGLLDVEAQLYLDVQPFEAFCKVDVTHLSAQGMIVIVRVAPLREPHLLTHQIHADSGSVGDRQPLAVLVNRDRGLVPVLNGPDDVFGTPCCVATREDARTRSHVGGLVHNRHVPLVELDADVVLDPGEGRVLANRQYDACGGEKDLAGHLLFETALPVGHPIADLERHTLELAVLEDEVLGGVVFDDLYQLLLGVLKLPGRRLEMLPSLATHHLDPDGTEPPRGAAAVHRGVADPDDQDLLLDLGDVSKCHRFQPGDADLDPGCGFLSARNIEVLALGRAAADEDRVETTLLEEGLHRRDVVVEPKVHPNVEDHVNLFVENVGREPELGNVRPHEPAGLPELLEDRALVAER